MLLVKTPAEANKIISDSFKGSISAREILPLHACLGRVLAEDICSSEDVPGYARSTVDGCDGYIVLPGSSGAYEKGAEIDVFI